MPITSRHKKKSAITSAAPDGSTARPVYCEACGSPRVAISTLTPANRFPDGAGGVVPTVTLKEMGAPSAKRALLNNMNALAKPAYCANCCTNVALSLGEDLADDLKD